MVDRQIFYIHVISLILLVIVLGHYESLKAMSGKCRKLKESVAHTLFAR